MIFFGEQCAVIQAFFVLRTATALHVPHFISLDGKHMTANLPRVENILAIDFAPFFGFIKGAFNVNVAPVCGHKASLHPAAPGYFIFCTVEINDSIKLCI